MPINKRQNIIVRSSNRFSIVMGDTVVGLLQDLRCQDDYSPEPASGIGSIAVREYVPTMARHTISTSQACMFTDSLRKLGVSLNNGNDAMRGLVFDIQIHDRSGIKASGSNAKPSGDETNIEYTDFDASNKGNILRIYKKCSFANSDIEIRKHAMVVTNATINACDVGGPAGADKNEVVSEI